MTHTNAQTKPVTTTTADAARDAAAPTAKPGPRSIGSATLLFGLVSVPVKLYTSRESSDESNFHIHHETDGGRLKQQYVCQTCNNVVERDAIVKGYEYAKGQYVLLSADELDALDAIATNQIQIDAFVDAGDVDPTYVDKTYYLGPDKGSERAFQLVADALDETNKAAIAIYSRHGAERVVVVRAPEGGLGLVLHELRFSHEVKALSDVPPTRVKTAAPELRLAKQIIGQQTARGFDIGKFRDNVRDRVVKLIEAKVSGGEIVAPPTVPVGGVVDLLEALRATMEAMSPGAKATTAKPATRARVKRVAKKSIRRRAAAR